MRVTSRHGERDGGERGRGLIRDIYWMRTGVCPSLCRAFATWNSAERRVNGAMSATESKKA